MYRIGVISDTHDHLDPRVTDIFAGVDHILHAGDIGMPRIIAELEEIAPVTAVLGNNDMGLPYRETEVIELAGRKFLIHHIVNPARLSEPLCQRIQREQPAAVVFGHTHLKCSQTMDGVLYFNPGYSGRPKGGTDRSVAILACTPETIMPKFFRL